MAGQAFNGSSMVAVLVAMITHFKFPEKLRQTQPDLTPTEPEPLLTQPDTQLEGDGASLAVFDDDLKLLP